MTSALSSPSPASSTALKQPRSWPRLVVVEALNLPPLALAWFGAWPMALWLAALIGSAVCCAGTDSGWRWRNRLLILQAILWLTAALVLAT